MSSLLHPYCKAIAKLTASSIKKQLPSMHKTHTGLSDAQAEIEYLKEAQKLQEYGIIFNKVSKYKKDKRGGFSLGISVRGLIVYEERGIVKSPTFRHPWQNIKRMAFHRRRFYIEAHGDPETSKLVLYTCSYKKSRYLLKMCTSFYKFQMMMGMRLSNLKEYPKDDGVVRMNGVVKTDETDSVAGDMPVPTEEAKPNQAQDSAVIQPPGIGPAIHLNGSAGPKQEDQPVQVSVHPVQLQKVDGSLGLNIIGGIELGGIYVKTMAPEGPASLSGKINIGDRILEINGQSLEGLSRQEAVNILRTAPYVCTMLIESCVAAPATPNGKPALPGSQSTSAFYQPNRHQQMQPMMQRQPSLESQCSSVHQQFVPGKSHQIEDIVSVSTLSIEKTKSVTSLPLDKHNSSDTLAWGQPLEVNPAAVSAQIRKRAMRKKMMISESASLDKGGSQTSMEEPKDLRKATSTIASPQITESAPRNKLSMSAFSFFGSFQGKRDEHAHLTNKDVKSSVGDHQFPTGDNLEQQPGQGNQGMFQGENPSGLDEHSTLLNFPEQKVPENDDSNVVGFFRKIQSFLFSPSTTFSQSKQPDEAESSCCESDLDSEFSEITSGSFNPGEIESVREELESLLLRDSPNSQTGVCVELTHGELPLGEHSGEPVSQGQVSDFETKEGSNIEKGKKESGELGSRFSIFRALSVFAKNDKPLEENKKDKTLEDDGNDKASEDDAIDKSLENDTMEKWDDEHPKVHYEDIEDKKQLITTEDTKSKSTVDEGLEKSSPADEDVKQEEQRDREVKESSIDTSTENKKETTV